MPSTSGVPPIPWRTILLALAAATALAWIVGFGAGLLVRWYAPSPF